MINMLILPFVSVVNKNEQYIIISLFMSCEKEVGIIFSDYLRN